MENTNILIIEDNNDINEMIYNYLNKNGFKCYQAYSGTEGLLYCKNDNYDLIILDLMLPGMDGKSVLVKIREKSDIPVIVLTAKDSLNSKVEILEIGADDYLCKPFELEELLARIHVQLRKSNKKTNNMTFKKLTLDNQIYDAIINNQPLQLTRHEYYILELLIKNPKRVFTKQEIYHLVCQIPWYGLLTQKNDSDLACFILLVLSILPFLQQPFLHPDVSDQTVPFQTDQ